MAAENNLPFCKEFARVLPAIDWATLPPWDVRLVEWDEIPEVWPRRYQVSRRVRRLVFERDGDTCHYCQNQAETLDHKIPFARGGTDDPANLVPACFTCNRRKGVKGYEEFRNSLQIQGDSVMLSA
jgi:5-methylcytosine-specific restriction endonuclease McrA